MTTRPLLTTIALQEYLDLKSQRDSLAAALRPFVAEYERRADPVGDSDLDGEQPRSVAVTLGDCRRAARVLGGVAK